MTLEDAGRETFESPDGVKIKVAAHWNKKLQIDDWLLLANKGNMGYHIFHMCDETGPGCWQDTSCLTCSTPVPDKVKTTFHLINMGYQ